MTKIEPNLKHKADVESIYDCPRCKALLAKHYYPAAVRESHEGAIEAGDFQL